MFVITVAYIAYGLESLKKATQELSYLNFMAASITDILHCTTFSARCDPEYAILSLSFLFIFLISRNGSGMKNWLRLCVLARSKVYLRQHK